MNSADDEVYRFLRRVGDVTKTDLVTREHAFGHHGLCPLTQAVPEFLAHEDQWERPNLSALNQGHGFEHFIEGAEPARHDDERAGVFHEADFAREEVTKLDARIDVRIGVL